MWQRLLKCQVQQPCSAARTVGAWSPLLPMRVAGTIGASRLIPPQWSRTSSRAAAALASSPSASDLQHRGSSDHSLTRDDRRCYSSNGSGTNSSSGSADISDKEWGEVLALLGDMAASKNRYTVTGVRRNDFELMPIFMQRVGLTPERLANLNFIHVAGTKGKGSTCAMVESILRSCGYRTGLYTSPHLVDVRERIRLDGQMLPRGEFAAAFWRVYGALRAAAAAEEEEEGGEEERRKQEGKGKGKEPAAAGAAGGGAAERQHVGMPSFFYFLTLMAMDAFLARPPHLAPHVVVLEVGIGGRLDATNAVVTRGSLAAAAITSLGFDHMEMLGDTLPKIAREKAGIMKAGRPVLAAPQPPDAAEALQEVATRVGSQLVHPPPLDRYRPSSSSAAAAVAQSSSLSPGPTGRGTRTNSNTNNNNTNTSSTNTSSSSYPAAVLLPLGLGGDHMRVNAALAIPLVAEWEEQYAAAAAAAAAAMRTAAAASGATGVVGTITATAAATAATAATIPTTTATTAAAATGAPVKAVEAAVAVSSGPRAVAVSSGPRAVALLPGGPDPRVAAARAAAVKQQLLVPEAYVAGLRDVRWPGRSQVVPDDVAASRGAHLTFYLDGAHTPESMRVCGQWFAAEVAFAAAAIGAEGTRRGSGGASERHVTALLFNCMKERDPVVLLPELHKAFREAASSAVHHGATAVQQEHPKSFDLAVFTPMLSGGAVMLPPPSASSSSSISSSSSFSSSQPVPAAPSAAPPQQPQYPGAATATGGAVTDLSWQVRMRDVWTSSCVGGDGQGGGGSGDRDDGSGATTAAAAADAAATSGHGSLLPGYLGGGVVVESLPQALETVRTAAVAAARNNDPRVVRVHVLVTGSLYLVGDVLRLLNKPPL